MSCRKAGTGDLFRLSRRKSCLRMPHSPDRTATTASLVHPNRSVVSVHFGGSPPCPIRLRVPHPSSFPRESGIGRPGTAGNFPVYQSGKQGGCPAFTPPHPDPPPPVGRGKKWVALAQYTRGEGMICQRGDPPESRNGGPIPPFPQEKLFEDAALAGSDSDYNQVGSSKPLTCLGPFRLNPPCPIRPRVPHPSSFPRESGIGRPGTAG
jgi:hypothetical protein